jgi:hypothetical protein
MFINKKRTVKLEHPSANRLQTSLISDDDELGFSGPEVQGTANHSNHSSHCSERQAKLYSQECLVAHQSTVTHPDRLGI